MSTGTARDCDDCVLTRNAPRGDDARCPHVSSPNCSRSSPHPRAPPAARRSRAPTCGCAPTARARFRGCRRGRCRRCGLPSHRRGCPASAAAFARAWAPLAYDGVARELVAALKFRGALPVAALMAAHMAANLPADLRCPPGPPITGAPAPPAAGLPRPQRLAATASSRSRRSPRAHAGAGSIRRERSRPRSRRGSACPSARACGGATARAARSARRGRSAAEPAGSSIELRAPPPARALLVDDVHTTGATLDACARALVAGGCREVVALTYARTL